MMYRNKSEPVVLWNKTNPRQPQSRSRKIIGMYYMMYNLTQADNGQYIKRDKSGLELEVINLYVKGEFYLKTKTAVVFSFTFFKLCKKK